MKILQQNINLIARISTFGFWIWYTLSEANVMNGAHIIRVIILQLFLKIILWNCPTIGKFRDCSIHDGIYEIKDDFNYRPPLNSSTNFRQTKVQDKNLSTKVMPPSGGSQILLMAGQITFTIYSYWGGRSVVRSINGSNHTAIDLCLKKHRADFQSNWYVQIVSTNWYLLQSMGISNQAIVIFRNSKRTVEQKLKLETKVNFS